MANNELQILLAEDDDGHASLVQRNLRRSGWVRTPQRARNGQEALDQVRRWIAGDNADLPRPLLLLLDINLPLLDGIEVLRQIKSNAATAAVPVIMLTTTDDPREIERCYALGCSVYVTKPVDYEALAQAVQRLGWFLQVIRVPGRESERRESGGQSLLLPPLRT